MDILTNIKLAIGAIGAVLGSVIVENKKILITLIVMIILDYITGVMSAIFNKKLSSEIGARGIVKKACIFCIVAVAIIIDHIIVKDGNTVSTAVAFFYIANEGISVIENAVAMDLPVPSKLKSILEQIRDDEDEEEQEEE